MAQARVQNLSEERLKVAGGLKIVIRSWRPDANARGVVVIVPEFNSHSGHYGWAAEQLVAERLLLSSPRSCIRAPRTADGPMIGAGPVRENEQFTRRAAQEGARVVMGG